MTNADRPTLDDLMQRASNPDPAIAAAGTHALGQAYAARREYGKAAEALQRAASLDPVRPEWLFHLAEALACQSKWDPAIDALRRGLAIRFSVGAAVRLSGWYRDAGDTAAATEIALEALWHAPQKSAPYEALCDVLVTGRSAGEIGEIEAHVASLAPPMQSLPMRIGLAHALEGAGRYDEARECWTTVLGEAPDDLRCLIGAAEVEVVLDNLDGAALLFDRALTLQPNDAGVMLACTEFLMRRGRFRELWDRIRAPRATPRSREPGSAVPTATFQVQEPKVAPRWDGTQSLDGKTILMECRGGYGDIFQFSRFAALCKERGASVVLEVPPNLVDLLRTMKAADEVVAPYDACRAFDYQCRAAYLAFFVEWTPRWMQANTPYLGVDPARRRAWNDRFARHRHETGQRLNVGIIWRTTADNHRNPYMFRSVPLAEFRPLADVPGVTLYGLQVGAGTEELTADTRSWLAANFESETRDFRDAAAAIDALDVIVSPDSGLAHLTGALGKPCFVMLPRHSSWRWMTAVPDFTSGGGSVWYPAMRLFRQEVPGDWSAPMRQIADSLRSLALGRTQHILAAQ